jgi:hypothetical protein
MDLREIRRGMQTEFISSRVGSIEKGNKPPPSIRGREIWFGGLWSMELSSLIVPYLLHTHGKLWEVFYKCFCMCYESSVNSN